jgi:hypothetical protein
MARAPTAATPLFSMGAAPTAPTPLSGVAATPAAQTPPLFGTPATGTGVSSYKMTESHMQVFYIDISFKRMPFVFHSVLHSTLTAIKQQTFSAQIASHCYPSCFAVASLFEEEIVLKYLIQV